MQLSISAPLALALVTVILIKKSGLKPAHAAVCTLLGFYLASSSLAPTIRDAVSSAARMLAGITF